MYYLLKQKKKKIAILYFDIFYLDIQIFGSSKFLTNFLSNISISLITGKRILIEDTNLKPPRRIFLEYGTIYFLGKALCIWFS